jgi:hypothetical protein
MESIRRKETLNISIAMVDWGVALSGTSLLLLVLLLALDPSTTLGGQVASKLTARSHAGSTVSCRLLLLLPRLLLLLPPPFFALPLLLPVRSNVPGQLPARPFQKDSRCSPRAMSG